MKMLGFAVKRDSFTQSAVLSLALSAAAIVPLACSGAPPTPSAPAAMRTSETAQHVAPQPATSPTSAASPDAAELVSISRQKWLWMAERKVAALAELFHDEAVFVHMGGTMSKAQELEIIDSGTIHYKHADIHETSVRFIGATAIVLSKLQLDAVVGGNEVSNPFAVTEVYVHQDASWRLAAMSFTRLLGQ